MKRFVKLICAVLCLSFLLGSAVFARADNDGLYAFVSVNRASLYKTAGMNSRIKYLYKFELVTVLQSDGSKSKVTGGGKTGYIYNKYLKSVSPVNETAYVNRATKVYARPSTSSASRKIERNTRVNVLMYSGSWAMIEKDGNLAYIQKAFLSETQTEESTAPISVRGKTDYTLSGNVVECDFQATVTASSLRVYSKASTSSSKLGTVKKNTVVNVYAYNSSWAYIELNGKWGYCRWAYLKKAPTAESATPTPTEKTDGYTRPDEPLDAVTNDKIKVYDKASTSGKYLGYISKDTPLQVLAYNDSWAQISLKGKTGFTPKSGLTLSAAAPTPTPTVEPTATPTPAPTYASTDDIFLNASTTNEQKIYEYLTSRTDYNEAVACGILASIKQESNFSPTSGKGSGYQGLCQWSTSRFAILTDWCERNNYNPYSLEGQIKFLWYDLSQRYTVYHKALLAMENTAEGAYQAGYYFCYYYERPSSLESSSVKRGTNAKDVYWVKYAH